MEGYKVILKDGKPFLRMTTARGNQTDMKIWKADTDKPYVKYASSYIGICYLDGEMREQLEAITEPPKDFVSRMWTDANWYDKPEPITVEDAAYNLEQYDAEGFDHPPITPEEFASIWNSLCA